MRRARKGNVVWYTVGELLIIVACCMVLPIITALFYRETCINVFLFMMPLTLGIGIMMMLYWRPAKKNIHLQVRDGAAIVTFGWIFAAALGMCPYLLAGTFDTVADAFFEAMSGFATVGASVLDNIEGQPHTILMWRSVTHWLGGMGIIVLFVALLSNLGAGAMQMVRAETAGPVKDKLHPKIADSARSLWLLYIFNTAITFLLLFCCKMDAFDALNHAFSIVATGGFSTRNSSIGSYESPLLEWAMVGAMYMSGINYALLFMTFRNRSLRHFWKNREFCVYTGVVLGAVFLVTISVLPEYQENLFTALRQSAFHVLSIITTTGFVCCDYEQWPTAAYAILILLMFSGACAGSTTCGFKIDRHIILVQQVMREVQRFLHPRLVRTLKACEKRLTEQTLHSVTAFFYLFVALTLFSTFIVCCMGVDFLDSFTGALACLGGVGPAIGMWGPTESFSSAPRLAKWLFSALMLLGRLEIYTVLAIFWPSKSQHLWYKKLQFFSEQEE